MQAGFLCLLFSCAHRVPWTDLFNGKDLSGWTQKNGFASFTVENGEIVGRTVPGSPNSFLCTDSIYDDFILEFEVKKDCVLNSGVQIRSNSYPLYMDGRVYGYQVEIENRPERRWSGGIYDEARRGWLCDLSGNEAGSKAFDFIGWNKYRVEAVGTSIKVWVNGVPTANLIDDMTPAGFIGLQVHSIPDDSSMAGLEVRWRNIRIITTNVEKYTTPMELTVVNTDNTLTGKETEQGWELLFDGKTNRGWRKAYEDSFPDKGWEVKKGMLTVKASEGLESQNGGDIVTVAEYSDFILELDFRLTKGANSGIKYFVAEAEENNKASAIGLEYQLLDDANHPDAMLGNHEGSRTLASLYDLIKAENKLVFPVGQWNRARIVSKGNHVEHWLNGIKVLEYERKTASFRQLVKESKYRVWPGFGEADSGHILLQDHGNEVSFKNIKILEIRDRI
ncbi:MAG: DUF1080 domain-containing protein [Bacteroidales bacterium]|nr:DUF1080 domain-containing protein [Bacteroidales bacterium]